MNHNAVGVEWGEPAYVLSYREGVEAYRSGVVPTKNPYAKGTTCSRAWTHGYNDAMSVDMF